MAPSLYVVCATKWLERAATGERRDEVEFRFRTWIKRQVERGHSPDVAGAILLERISAQPGGHKRYSRELLDEIGELAAPGEQRLPDETDDARERRKAQTAAFLRRGGNVADESAADPRVAEAERDELDRLSPRERDELDQMRGGRRG